MQSTVGGESQQAWHQALAYAVLGRRLPGLATQAAPSVTRLAAELVADVGAEAIGAALAPGADRPWPHPVPAHLMDGLGHAQFSAALRQLRQELDLLAGSASRPRVGADEPITAGDRRLLDEVPPHHGR